jgi:hypothetical protein
MSDHIENVNPAGVIGVGYFADISAWVMPPIRYGEPGMLTSEVNQIVRSALMMRR